MVPEKYQLAAVAQNVIGLWEVRRPGLQAFDAAASDYLVRETEPLLGQMEQQCRELGVDDPAHWSRARELVRGVLLPRWLLAAQRENALAARDYGLWRGGDLVARAGYALLGLAVGIVLARLPYLPSLLRWLPVALFLAAPFFPDIQLAWHRRRHAKALEAMVSDLALEGARADAYRPLSDVQRALGLTEAPAESNDPQHKASRRESA